MQAGPGIVYFKTMNGLGQTANWVRRTIGLALILLFGPAPVLSLLAQSDEPQCQMACCRRKGAARCCPLHHAPAADTSGPGFHAAGCPPGCSQAAAGPSAFAAGILLSGASLVLPNHHRKLLLATRASGMRWILDSFLHQRPPPRRFA